MSTWIITKTDFTPAARAAHNSIFTISNGYWALNGILLEDRCEIHPTTIINGVYDLCNTFMLLPPSKEKRYYLDEEYFDQGGPTPAVANLPSPLYVRVYVGENELCLQRGRITQFRQTLDLRTGVYAYRFVHTDAAGRRTRVEQERFSDMVHLHYAYLRYRITPLNYHSTVRLVSGIDGTVTSNVVGDHQYDVTDTRVPRAGLCRLDAVTRARRIDVSMAVWQRVCAGTRGLPLRPAAAVCGAAHVEEHYCARLNAATSLVLEKIMCATSSEDKRNHAYVPVTDVEELACKQSCDSAYAAQRAFWREMWRRVDVQIAGDARAQRYLRFCLFHLVAAAPRHTDTLGVPVKLLTGEYYQGNTFYDTDTYIVPFYTYTMPAWARNVLHWRYRGLKHGRAIAQQLGFPGAKLAWQAGPYGEECLGRWWHFTHSNIHINADVAYAMLQYTEVTGDEEFMWQYGVEFLIESARFYAARAVYDERDQRYHYHDCAGPDEGHCTSTDNFYTNYLAQQTLRAAAAWAERMQTAQPARFARLAARLTFRADECVQWRNVADRLAFLYDEKTKLFEQYDGFYQLEDVSDDFFARRRDRKEWFAPVRPYQAIHQPDVEMAMVLYRPHFRDDVVRANHAFYYPRTMNFSSMSFGMHALMCADLGELDEAYTNFIISAGMDIDEELTGRKDTRYGLHGTACGGAWMAVVCGFGGVRMHDGVLHITPRLPRGWKAVRFSLMVRGLPVQISITPRSIRVRAGRGAQCHLPVVVAGTPMTLRSGTHLRKAL